MGRNKLLSFSTHRGDFLMWTGLMVVIERPNVIEILVTEARA